MATFMPRSGIATTASLTDLHIPDPAHEYFSSYAQATDGQQQVGFGTKTNGSNHAFLWSGTGASAIELNPAGFRDAWAIGIANGLQVGSASGPSTANELGFQQSHAMVWAGTAASAFDLHQYVPAGFYSSDAHGIDDSGVIVGVMRDGTQTRAVAWIPVPEPMTGLLLLVIGAWRVSRRARG